MRLVNEERRSNPQTQSLPVLGEEFARDPLDLGAPRVACGETPWVQAIRWYTICREFKINNKTNYHHMIAIPNTVSDKIFFLK